MERKKKNENPLKRAKTRRVGGSRKVFREGWVRLQRGFARNVDVGGRRRARKRRREDVEGWERGWFSGEVTYFEANLIHLEKDESWNVCLELNDHDRIKSISFEENTIFRSLRSINWRCIYTSNTNLSFKLYKKFKGKNFLSNYLFPFLR